MKLGQFDLRLVTDGTFKLDGGAMFGVVPRPLWKEKMPPDSRNRILLAMNCWLVRGAGHVVLIETRAGDKWDAKYEDIYGFQKRGRLPEHLAALGVRPEDVTIVINTHLHFDHCGWNTRRVGDQLVPTFPNARYVVQRGELAHAGRPSERDRASYVAQNFEPIDRAGRWQLAEGDATVIPGIDLVRVPGHTRDMQCVRIAGGGQTALMLADLIPTCAHLAYPWIMSFDLYPMVTLENKKKWLPRLAREGWLCLFAHDPRIPAAFLHERNGKFEPKPVAVD